MIYGRLLDVMLSTRWTKRNGRIIIHMTMATAVIVTTTGAQSAWLRALPTSSITKYVNSTEPAMWRSIVQQETLCSGVAWNPCGHQKSTRSGALGRQKTQSRASATTTTV